MKSKLQQAIEYNTAHLPRTAEGLVALQPDARRDPEFRNQLRSEIQQILEELQVGTTMPQLKLFQRQHPKCGSALS